MINNWILIILGLAALYSITIFVIQVLRYFKNQSSGEELLDDDLENE